MARFFKKKDDKNVKKRGGGMFKRRKFVPTRIRQRKRGVDCLFERVRE